MPDRSSVKTYISPEQKDIWKEHAESMDMSMSEFLRCMVQAGRSKISPPEEEGRSQGSNPRGNGLETRLQTYLENKGPATWGELVDAFEDDLDEALASLEEEGTVKQRRRGGDFVLTERQ